MDIFTNGQLPFLLPLAPEFLSVPGKAKPKSIACSTPNGNLFPRGSFCTFPGQQKLLLCWFISWIFLTLGLLPYCQFLAFSRPALCPTGAAGVPGLSQARADPLWARPTPALRSLVPLPSTADFRPVHYPVAFFILGKKKKGAKIC